MTKAQQARIERKIASIKANIAATEARQAQTPHDPGHRIELDALRANFAKLMSGKGIFGCFTAA